MRTVIRRGIGMGRVFLVLLGLALATVIAVDVIIVPASGLVSEETGIAGEDLTVIPELQIDALPPTERSFGDARYSVREITYLEPQWACRGHNRCGGDFRHGAEDRNA